MAAGQFTFKTTGFDPIAAVNRQMRFADKMAQFDWFHSPAVSSTLETALERYIRFFQLMTSSPSMVPTLDVDLVWHTHQLSPSRYLFFCKEHHGGLIDHDDKVEGSTIENGFNRTQQMYQARFAENYVLCHSWYCEVGRLLLKDGILLEDHSGLDYIIEVQNRRRKTLGVRVFLDLAPCQCKSPNDPGTALTECTSNCGSDCSSNCHQGCSSDCCGSCNSGCAGV